MLRFKIFVLICILICSNLLFSIRPNAEKEEVVFWTVQLAPFSNYINGVISSFEKQYPSVKIKWIDVPYSEAEKRVLASLLSNSMPDLINITADFNLSLATKGALNPITSDLTDYNPALINVLKFDEKVWGVPFYATSAITIYNKKLLEEFDIKVPPKTYDELFAQIKTTHLKENQFLFMPTLTENDTLYKILNKYNFNTPENLISDNSIEFFSTLQKLYQENKLPKESITQTHREVIEKYSSNQIAYLQAGANFLNIIKENSQEIYNNTDVSEQFYGTEPKYDFSLMTLAIPLKAKHKENALIFAKYITNEENQLLFAKETGVLPCNKKTLNNEYFTEYNNTDLASKARYISAKQLSSPITYPQQKRNHKNLITLLNSTVEQILLKNLQTQPQLELTAKKWSQLDKN